MIVIIDYKMGNLRSVSKALEKAGGNVKITNNVKDIQRADAIVLPGVGAFGRGMKNLKEAGLISPLIDAIKQGKPFLGICLGMQLLFTYSEEHGKHRGLNILEGCVKRFHQNLKIPHMGWNQIILNQRRGEKKKEIFYGIPDKTYFYFVHSYYVIPENKEMIIATTNYGVQFASAVQKENIFGVQFHPEKSQTAGLKLLRNFVSFIKEGK
jgi:glutamine amidotransferase